MPIWNWIESVESQKQFFFCALKSFKEFIFFWLFKQQGYHRENLCHRKNDHTLALSHQSFNFWQCGICLSQHVPWKTFNFLTMYIFFQYKTINQTLKLVLNTKDAYILFTASKGPRFAVPGLAGPEDGRSIMDLRIWPEVQDLRPDQIFEIEKYQWWWKFIKFWLLLSLFFTSFWSFWGFLGCFRVTKGSDWS